MKISGIYAIRHIVSGRQYIGSSGHIRQRHQHHWSRLRKGRHHSPALQNYWNKYGPDAFEFLILEECPPKHLEEREQFYIDQHNAYMRGFNGRPAAGSLLGSKWSAKAHETRKRKKSNQKPFRLISPEGEFVEGIGLTDLAQKNKLSACCLSSVMAGRIPSHKGWRSPDFITQEVKKGSGNYFFPDRVNTKKAHYRFLSPNGEILEGDNISAFCQKMKLRPSAMNQVNSGAMISYKGWRSPDFQYETYSYGRGVRYRLVVKSRQPE